MNTVKKEYDDGKNKFPNRMREELHEHCKKISSQINEYYMNLFIEKNDDKYNRKQACATCIIFDPTLLKGKEHQLGCLNCRQTSLF